MFALLFAVIVLFKACSLSEETIKTRQWKFFDDHAADFPRGDFLYFEGGDWSLRNDTVFRTDTAFAVVDCAYHKYSGKDRLFLRILSSGRIIEFVGS